MSSVNADLRARLAQVDESILELKLRLKALEDTRKSILRQLDGVVYPVLTLPHDITSSIFLHCLPADTNSAAKKGPNSTRAPILLLPVCRTWRDIALSTPRLWASFQLNLFDISDRVGESELEKIIAGWLLRAGACALSFGADSPAYMGKFGAETIRAVLCRFAPQLQSVSLKLPTEQIRHLLDIGPFPVLETLTVDASSFPDKLGLLGAAPRLRNLLCNGAAGPSAFRFSYEGLSTLTCASLSPDRLFDVLLCAPSLEDFTGCVREEAVVRHIDVVTHQHLQSLHLSRGSSVHFLRLLRLPTLQSIYLATEITPARSHDLLPFLVQSSASLRRFSTRIYTPSMTTDWFSTCMPFLTEVDLSDPSPAFLRGFFQKLDRAQYRGFLPHLQSLTFRDCALDVDAPLLFQALSSRCIADEESSILRSFRVDITLSVDESQTAALAALVERGMSILVGGVLV
jgi:hypothetical protein